MLCYYMYDPLTYKFQSVKDKTDRKIIQILFRVQEEICWIGHYLAIIYVMQGPKMLKTDFFFLSVYIEVEKVTQGFLCIWLKDAAIWEHVIC